jgi:hypothetical protein
MAFPTDPPHPAGANASAFANARLTPEDAERLAATFRPSWELDDAPFTGPGALTEADLHALKGGGTQADVRGAVQALNGTHAPVPATVLQDEPTSSVIIAGGVDAEVVAAPAPAALPTPIAPQAQVAPMATKTGTLVLPSMQGAVVQQRTLVMATLPVTGFPGPGVRGRAASIDLGDVDFRKRSKSGLWIALGGVAAVLLGAGVWLASSSGDQKRAAPAPALPTTMATAPSRIPAPPPPAETVAAPPIAPAPPPPPAPVTPPPQPMAVAAAPPPPAPPPPRLVVPPAPRPPTWTPPASPPRPPAARPKSGQTIVRDVPF